MLGAWVGTGTYAARGVPERFLNPNALGPAAKRKIEEEERRKKEEEELKKKKKEEATEGEEKKPETSGDATAAAVGDVTMAEAPAVAG